MKITKKILVEQEEVQEIICNRCGQHFSLGKYGTPDPEILHIEHRWGYFSEKDGQKHQFDLCERCYDEIVKSFRVPVEIEE